MSKRAWFSSVVLMLIFVSPVLAADRSQVFEVGAGGSLVLTTSVGDVTLTTWERNQVAVEVLGIDEEEVGRLSMTQSGNVVRVDFRPQESSGNVRFRVGIPSRFDVDVKTAGGDITITGSLAGVVTGSTAGGDITVGDLNGKVVLRTSGGDVRAGSVQGDAELKTSGGDIQLASADGDVGLVTAGGDITVGDVGRSLTAKTSGGDIRVGDVGGEATLSTAGGDVRVGQVSGSATLTTAGGDVECESATGHVKARTAGGDLRLRGISGSLEGSTAGGDVVAELNPSGKGPSNLNSAGGNITLLIPDGARARIEATIKIQGRWRADSTRYEIRSDFKATEQVRDDQEEEIRAVFDVNGGGDLIRLNTVNGNITIRKAGAGSQ